MNKVHCALMHMHTINQNGWRVSSCNCLAYSFFPHHHREKITITIRWWQWLPQKSDFKSNMALGFLSPCTSLALTYLCHICHKAQSKETLQVVQKIIISGMIYCYGRYRTVIVSSISTRSLCWLSFVKKSPLNFCSHSITTQYRIVCRFPVL